MLSKNTAAATLCMLLTCSLAALAADDTVSPKGSIAGGMEKSVVKEVGTTPTPALPTSATTVPGAQPATPPLDKPPVRKRAPTRPASAGKPGVRAAGTSAKPARVVSSGRISGKLELAAGAKQPVAAGEVAESVVYFLPKNGEGTPKPARFSVTTQSKGFSPSLLVVPAGSTVSYPNRDQILHNVFSRSAGAVFDLGYFGPGEARETRFQKPGLVVVNCSVHNDMRSNVLVLATPYFVRPSRDGRFALDGVPPGPGTLVFWHPRAKAQSIALTGTDNKPLLQRLIAIRAPLDLHRH